MRAGLNTIQQTLTPEASSVLNSSIAEAGRRNHGQTTPLHVAAALLSSPTGFLRRACIKSHPNSSHPLQCRALELCFSVALERLPTAQVSGSEPPISNALMAALKRAQAHQRRGCPEQQQQPLLAVKVELEQLIMSILDDPSVSRVMREASFSSPAVKAAIEQSLNTSAPPSKSPHIELAFRPPTATPVLPGRNLYLNPRLQGGTVQTGTPKIDEVKKVIDILLRKKKRNPVLVGESEPENVIKELLKRIELNQLDESQLKNIQVIPLEIEIFSEKAEIPTKIEELGNLIESRLRSSNGGSIVLNLGDLKWLVEQPGNVGTPSAAVSEAGKVAVSEMGKLMSRFGDGQIWLIGTATCETYLRCQVYYPSMENDWDLHAIPIAARAPLPGLFPRIGGNGILSSSVESVTPMKEISIPMTTVSLMRPVSNNLDSATKTSCCPQCLENYELELAKYKAEEAEKSSSELKPEAAAAPSLPPWLQNAKAEDRDSTDRTQARKEKAQELQKKWNDSCLLLHPSFHQKSFEKISPVPVPRSLYNPNLLSSEKISPVPIPRSLYNPNLLGRQSIQPKPQLNKNIGESLQLNMISKLEKPADRVVSPPGSPVGTNLALGQNPHKILADKLLSILDPDPFKKLLKTLTDKVWWQREAASAVATTVMQCKLGNGKRRGGGSKGDIWLLFIGPDRVGKRKMASALAETATVSKPVIISLGSDRKNVDSNASFRGRTAMDRISETIRRNPSSVIMLEEIDEADLLVSGSIKRALEKGRLTDSHGREISISNIIFILTATWLPENLKHLSKSISLDDQKIYSLANSSWQLRLCVSDRRTKRRADWQDNEDRSIKQRSNNGFGFDLNELAEVEDDRTDGSFNSSEITVEGEDDLRIALSLSRELRDTVDDAIVFKPVEFDPIKQNVQDAIAKRWSVILGEGITLEVQEAALEKITAGMWLGTIGMEEWVEKSLVPGFRQLNARFFDSTESIAARLELDCEMGCRSEGEWLPDTIKVVV